MTMNRTGWRNAVVAGATLGLLVGVLATGPATAETGAPPLAAPTAAAPTAATESGATEGGRPVNLAPRSRAESLALYQDLYLRGADSQIGWTGSIGSCNPGTTTLNFRTGVLRRINYYRAMAGVPDDITFTGDFNARAQRVALMMAANQQLNHTPPATWNCATTAGRADANRSNLSMSNFGTTSIDAYMADSGASNNRAGHRRWLLNPPTRNMGTGDIPGSSPFTRINALFVFDSRIFDNGTRTREPYVAWPPPGFVPQTVVYPRWSFGIDDANFTNATVTVTRNGSAVTETRHAPQTGYGINTLVWDIPNTLAGRKGEFHVRIAGVVVNGQTRSYEYGINVFDPDEPVDPVTIVTPADSATYARGSTVLADFSCAMANLASCVGTAADGAAIDTATLGAKSFTVTGTDQSGAQQTATHRYTVADQTKPSVNVTTPPDGAVFIQGQNVIADYACSDEVGGSGLVSCTAPVADGAALDTSILGQRPFTVTATDAAGNQRVVDRGFRVSMRPDAQIGLADTGPFVGDGVYGATSTPAQTQSANVARGGSEIYFVSIGNDAGGPAVFSLDGTARDAAGYKVNYLVGRTDVTAAVNAGTYRLPSLAQGATIVVKIKITATSTAPRGSTAKVDLEVSSTGGPPTVDLVRAKLTTN